MSDEDKVKRYTVSWFDEFECLCGDCPESCCRGWVIPLSDRDFERFRKEKGMLGYALFAATGGGLREKFNPSSRSCPFWRRDGLCSLQRKRGHDFIPWTCQSYPRFYRNFGDIEECCLDLSCIGATRLFMAHGGTTDTVVTESEPVTKPCTTNDDKDYLDFLLAQRKDMIETVQKGFSGALCDALFDYAAFLQDEIVAKNNNDYKKLSFTHFYGDLCVDKDEDDDNRTKTPCTFPLAPRVLSGFLATSLWHQKLRRVSPKLYRMLSRADRALRRFEKYPSSWQAAVSATLGEDPYIETLLGQYLGYYLFQYFMRVYETYSFRKQIALGLCHVNMILLLAVTFADRKDHPLTGDDLALIISVYNRRAYFNDSITDEMYRVFEDAMR